MQLMLNIPMLANHRDAGGGRAHQTGKVEAVVTRDRGLLVGRPNGFHSNHRLQAWPWLQRWQGSYVCHPPDSSAHATAVGRVERIKAIVRIAPRELGLDMLLQVRCDG